MADTVSARAYNSLSQFRADAWCSLEEASERLSEAAAAGRPLDGLVARVGQLLDELGPIERYWAYPGSAGLLSRAAGCSRPASTPGSPGPSPA